METKETHSTLKHYLADTGNLLSTLEETLEKTEFL